MELMKGNANQLQQNKPNATLPVRDSDSRRHLASEKRNPAKATEDARSVRTERHYDKTTRTGRSQEPKGESHSVRSSHSNNKNERQSVQSSHDYNKYARVSSSNVSQPDNLVCDNCINHKLHDNKLKDLADQRDKDREHAQRININIKSQFEREKRMHLEKLKLYQDAIDTQNADQLKKKELQRQADQKEKDKLRKAFRNNDDVIARERLEYEKKQKFIYDLKEQMDIHQQLKYQRELEQLELDKKNGNLLIDDAWREPHKQLLKDHFKNNLLNQLQDKDAEKAQMLLRKKAEDAQYKRELLVLGAKDQQIRKDLEAQKKGIFMEELDNQLKEKNQLKNMDQEIKNLENENWRRKIQQDNDIYMDILFRKKVIQDETLAGLAGQINENDLKKQLERENDKKPGLTSVPLPDKQNKCYDCKVCRHNYPLKMLNKKKKL